MVSGGEQDELRRLREENARFKELLTQHGIAWEEPTIPEPVSAPTESAPTPTHFTTDDKIALFRRLIFDTTKNYSSYYQRITTHKNCLGTTTGCFRHHATFRIVGGSAIFTAWKILPQ